MLTILKKITYKPGVCLDLYLSSKGNLIGNMKLNKKNNPIHSNRKPSISLSTLDITPNHALASNVLNPPITVYMLMYNKCKPSTEL